jgi:hypothetical protein
MTATRRPVFVERTLSVVAFSAHKQGRSVLQLRSNSPVKPWESRRRRRALGTAVCASGLAWFSLLHDPVFAQPATRPPPVDPMQIERRIETLEVEQRRAAKPAPTLPKLSRPAPQGAHKPLFRLTSVSIEGAQTIPLSPRWSASSCWPMIFPA